MTMKKRWFWFVLSGCALMAVAGLWWWQASLVDPEYAPTSAIPHDTMELTQTAGVPSPSPFSIRQNPASPEANPVSSSSIPTAQKFDDYGKLNNTANLPLITAGEEAVRDTGEFLDPDAEIPPQSLDDEAEPMDTGPFINADFPPH
jgi:hypothetical protein